MGFRVNDVVNTGGFPFYLINELISTVKVDWFIETGSASGGTIKEAAKLFKRCVTMELVEGRQKQDEQQNIEWLTGHSVELLLPVVNELISEKNSMQTTGKDRVYNYAIFFLDAHYDGDKPPYSPYKDCYLLEELEIISPYQDSAIIFIDDARLFFGHPPAPNNPKEWPTIREIFALLEKLYPFNTTTIRDDFIISYPSRLDEIFDAEWRKNYTKRYPSAEDKLKTETKNVYEAFKKYIDV